MSKTVNQTGAATTGSDPGQETPARWGVLLHALAGMGLWAVLPERIAGWMLIPAWLVCWQLIFTSGFEIARLRRRAWLGQYLIPGSLWAVRLRGGALMALLQQVSAALLALWLVVRLRLLERDEWLVVLAGALVLSVVAGVLRHSFRPHVVEGYLSALVRRFSVMPVAGLMALALIGLSLGRAQPYYAEMSWAQALHYGLQGYGGDSVLASLERMALALDVTRYWAMQTLAGFSAGASALVVVGWVLLFALQSAFAWSFVRLLNGAEIIKERLGRKAGQ